jgi:hypothetical protein
MTKCKYCGHKIYFDYWTNRWRHLEWNIQICRSERNKYAVPDAKYFRSKKLERINDM